MTAETLSPALPEDVERLAQTLLTRACAESLTLATAESCTGGLIASILTDVEGMGHAFERGFIVYTGRAKADMLALDPGLIARCGAVSAGVAIAMAQGALAASHADIAVAVTGFAGPAGPDDEPGLVHFASARRGQAATHHVAHFGDIGRGGVRVAATRVALEMMLGEIDRTAPEAGNFGLLPVVGSESNQGD
ncbi:CinA family protein [Sphingomonas colocasiae]|uniref:CinA family protein n=1 Tax=Sphingomonas colocasiae TaxID=1848973 RepID=A0ABS7PQI2_9SPHN|nr:CinA family protein [Sphingomonas colocasiae]MBY8823488.1 CinA family protein [Sphingomonas colocasiae]